MANPCYTRNVSGVQTPPRVRVRPPLPDVKLKLKGEVAVTAVKPSPDGLQSLENQLLYMTATFQFQIYRCQMLLVSSTYCNIIPVAIFIRFSKEYLAQYFYVTYAIFMPLS